MPVCASQKQIPGHIQIQIPDQIQKQIPDQIQKQIPGLIRIQIPGQIRIQIPGQIQIQIPGQIRRQSHQRATHHSISARGSLRLAGVHFFLNFSLISRKQIRYV